MPLYYNPHSYAVHLTGPDGNLVTIKGREEVELSTAYEQYVARGMILRKPPSAPALPVLPTARRSAIQEREEERRKQQLIQQARRQSRPPAPNTVHLPRQPVVRHLPARPQVPQHSTRPGPQVVGQQAMGDATQRFQQALSRASYPISNGVGVGILSYNRLPALRRLVRSIERHTDLDRTTVFICDDGSTDRELLDYLQLLRQQGRFVVIGNQQRLGVAGNSNRLLRCLARFPHLLLLNDDVEVLRAGWEQFYRQAMADTGHVHYIYRQPGVYGAESGLVSSYGPRQIRTVPERPHGAVLAADHRFLHRAGYFDEGYGLYGMEHVDWSSRAAECGLQPAGFHDVVGAERYFLLHHEPSSVPERAGALRQARQRFVARQPGQYVPPLPQSQLPAISFVVPYRDTSRTAAIHTVSDNLRAQRFPVVELVLVEQDQHSRCRPHPPCNYQLVPADNPLFNKSLAFNHGVQLAQHQCLVLHDADILAPADYAQEAHQALQQHESCFLGGRVIYTTQESAAAIAAAGRVLPDTRCDRVVTYFEGGSLGLTKPAYWQLGGYNEEFWGYGNEDCDFYYRMTRASRFLERRQRDLLHLWHPRVEGWQAHHGVNKQLEAQFRELDLQQYLQMCRDRTSHYRRG